MKKILVFCFILLVISVNAQNIQKAFGFSVELPKNWEFGKGKNNFLITAPKNEASVTITAHIIDINDPLQHKTFLEQLAVEAIKKEVPDIKTTDITRKMKQSEYKINGLGFVRYRFISEPDKDKEITRVEVYYSTNKKGEYVFFTSAVTFPEADTLSKYDLDLAAIIDSIKRL